MIGSLLLPEALWAEFYRYTGEDGAIHFTDDLSQVPPDQREQVESFIETESPQPPETPKKEPAAEVADRARQAVTFLEEKRAGLLIRQKNLKAEYKRLMEARAEIESLQQTADTPKKQRALQEKITALQAQVAEYQSKSTVLDKEVNAFNQAIKAGSSQDDAQSQ
jgi:hypothetical protein